MNSVVVQQRAANGLLHLDAAARVASALGSTRWLLMKGGALLASRIFSPWERHLDDLDIWVESGLAHGAFKGLLRAGFRPLEGPASATHAGVSSIDAPTHQLPILRSPHGAFVEVHLSSHATGEAGDFEACYAAGNDVVVNGVSLRVPSVRHLLEQLCAHVVVHHIGDLRFWPRHVNDVRRLVVYAPELASLRNRPDEVGLSLRVAHGVDCPETSDAWLARLFIAPEKGAEAAWRLLALGLRTRRFILSDPRSVLRVLVPAPAHLAFTGDLMSGRSIPDAHLRRWKRILRRSVKSSTSLNPVTES